MATFDDKSIFGKKEDIEIKVQEEESEEALEEEIVEEADEDSTEEIEYDEDLVIGEEVIESDKVRKKREKLEAKQKKIADKEYAKMVKKHRKEMKKNPENIKRYNTDADNGLPDEVVEKRILDDLVNVTKKGSSKSRKMIVFTNIFTFFNILTLSIAIWLMTIQAWTDLVFLVIVTANTVIGIYQELKAKKTIDRLSLLSAPSAVVIRGGVTKEINVSDVVLDDLIILNSGNQICADSVVVDGSVEVNESLLTGESNAIIKKAGDLLFSGSYVVSGKCLSLIHI